MIEINKKLVDPDRTDMFFKGNIFISRQFDKDYNVPDVRRFIYSNHRDLKVWIRNDSIIRKARVKDDVHDVENLTKGVYIVDDLFIGDTTIEDFRSIELIYTRAKIIGDYGEELDIAIEFYKHKKEFVRIVRFIPLSLLELHKRINIGGTVLTIYRDMLMDSVDTELYGNDITEPTIIKLTYRNNKGNNKHLSLFGRDVTVKGIRDDTTVLIADIKDTKGERQIRIDNEELEINNKDISKYIEKRNKKMDRIEENIRKLIDMESKLSTIIASHKLMNRDMSLLKDILMLIKSFKQLF